MFCIPLHCRGRAGEYRFSALSGPKCSKTCTPPCPRPSTPNPAYCFSETVTNVGVLPTIQRQHMLCIPLHCRGRARGVQVFSIFKPQTFQNLYSPASAAQHPQPCLLLPRRSNESRFPSHHTKTAYALYSPALPRARGGVQVFSTFSPKCSKTCTPPRPRASMNRGTGRNREPNRTGTEPLRTAIRFIPVQANPTEPNRTGTLLSFATTRTLARGPGSASRDA